MQYPRFYDKKQRKKSNFFLPLFQHCRRIQTCNPGLHRSFLTTPAKFNRQNTIRVSGDSYIFGWGVYRWENCDRYPFPVQIKLHCTALF